MNLIEQATRRLEELERVGIKVPWDVAGISIDDPAVPPASTSGRVVPSPPTGGGWVAPRAEADERAARAVREPAQPRCSIQVDLTRLGDNGYLVPSQTRSEMAEQFRHIKRALLKNARRPNLVGGLHNKHVMVTSALPGEGKTFCSVNMAMSMAMEVDTAVILVDADVIRPSVFGRLGLDASADAPRGLLDYLAGRETDLSQLLVATNVPKLLLMSTGPASSQSSELLASASMDRLLDQFTAEYPDHVVIFDAPPVLVTTESTVLAGKVGQVLMVVESGKTPKKAVRQASEALRHCPAVSTLLNKCDTPSAGQQYGYYYG